MTCGDVGEILSTAYLSLDSFAPYLNLFWISVLFSFNYNVFYFCVNYIDLKHVVINYH